MSDKEVRWCGCSLPIASTLSTQHSALSVCPMKPFRAGVIGVVHLGQHHARLYAALSGAQLI
ncbi:MAG: hypothetical protein HY281_14515, partial [Nitrospirae bacterium]|nr:hypothetical protein [Nitrospirota bacterium]